MTGHDRDDSFIVTQMNAFFTGLQFLTRISVVRQERWDAADFGRSVKYFPLIGAILGAIYAAAAYILFFFLPECGLTPPRHFAASLMLILPQIMTGGLHADGFMDTMDGVFSGRDREKMLVIMKDSRAGSNAVFTFVLLMIFEFSILVDTSPDLLVRAMFVMPVVGRLMMTAVIVLFPYARPEGIGRAFAQYADRGALSFALLSAAVLILPAGLTSFLSLVVCAAFSLSFARYTSKRLGGLTGDVYGAVELISEGLVLLCFLLS